MLRRGLNLTLKRFVKRFGNYGSPASNFHVYVTCLALPLSAPHHTTHFLVILLNTCRHYTVSEVMMTPYVELDFQISAL